MNWQEFMKNPEKAVDDEFKAIIKEAEAPYWKNFNSTHWSDKLDQDLEAQQDFIELGER